MPRGVCTKCGNTDNYNFALNIGLCDICIGEELDEVEQLQAENEKYKSAFNDIGRLLVLYPGIAEKKIGVRCEQLYQALKGK